MLLIIHRVNTIEKLKILPNSYGVEIDVRGHGDTLFLTHDPISNTKHLTKLEDYLRVFSEKKMKFIVINVKEAGYEQKIINLLKKYSISKKKYFLLDVEFPYLYRATRKEGIREIAVRYSEAEPIESVLAQTIDGKPLLDWVWIDTNTTLPLNNRILKNLSLFKTCLVCPERWGRPEDIKGYAEKMKKLSFVPDAIMTSEHEALLWKKLTTR